MLPTLIYTVRGISTESRNVDPGSTTISDDRISTILQTNEERKQEQDKFHDAALRNKANAQMISHRSPYIDVCEAVLRKMVHGPHSMADGTTSRYECMKNPDLEKMQCSKKYPKEFTNETTISEDGYPDYRRCSVAVCPASNASVLRNRKIKNVDNSSIVPHNRHIMVKFGTHCNIEFCGTVKVVKYMYKYVYKGPNRVAYRIQSQDEAVDEINDFLDERYIGDT